MRQDRLWTDAKERLFVDVNGSCHAWWLWKMKCLCSSCTGILHPGSSVCFAHI